jgi:hypothetical protein
MDVKQRIMDLNERRLIALEREEYEACGRIRDEIRQLEASMLDVSIKQHSAAQQVTDEAMIRRRRIKLDRALHEFDRLTQTAAPAAKPATGAISPDVAEVESPVLEAIPRDDESVGSHDSARSSARPERALSHLQRRQRARVAGAIGQTQRNLRSLSYDLEGQSLAKLFQLYDARRRGALGPDEFRAAVRKGGRVTNL